MDIVIDIITMLTSITVLLLLTVRSLDRQPLPPEPLKPRPKRRPRIIIKTETDEARIEEKKEAEKGWN